MLKKNVIKRLSLGMAAVLIGFSAPLSALGANASETDFNQYAEPDIPQERSVIGTVYRTDACQVQEAPSYTGNTVAELYCGQQVLIKGMLVSEGCLWYEVSFGMDDIEYTGYIEAVNVVTADEEFLAMEQEYLKDYEGQQGQSLVRAGMDDVNSFPVSYRSALAALKEAHPNWIFVPMAVNVDWSTVVTEEMRDGRSLVHSSKGDAWKGEKYSDGWYYATQAAVEYCLDPRNFLTEDSIFMFEQLTYNPSYHTVEAVQKITDNTFMAGVIPGETLTYAQGFYQIGSALRVSPYHLACRVYQEQGAGTSPLISGTYPGYEGYYNYFNVGASGSTNEAIYTSGLSTAKKYGWNTRMASLQGGAEFISKNYILKGQDTLYLQKFDVESSYYGMFSHQYQQNITAPLTEGRAIRTAYRNADALDNPFVFKIPVYQNMPMNACPEPSESSQPNVLVNEQLVKDFVVRLYELALGRESYQQSEIDGWYEELASGQKTGADVAWGFFFSEEFQAKMLSDEDYVETLYRVMFNRASDEQGKANWVGLLQNGMSRVYVYRGFANAEEFTNVCSVYGIERGTITLNNYRDQNPDVTAFVNRLYLKVLERNGDDLGMENWCKTILTKSDSVENVSYGFVFSQEFTEKETADGEFVQIMYRTFLDREADSEGYKDWTGRLAGGVSREEVFRGFVRSQEFHNLMQQYGVE